MKVLLYTENEQLLSKSGLGKAIKHQMKALDLVGVEYTTDKHDDYDIVHLNTYGIKSYNLAKSARKKGKKVVYHAHSTEEDFKNSFILSNQVSPLFKKWITKCYELGDFIITPTPYSKKLLESYGIKNPIQALSNGIEIDFFKREDVKHNKFRKTYGYKKSDTIIMGIGLFIERKGILDFVELARRMPEYEFIWFGYTAKALIPEKVKKAINTKLPNLKFPGYVESSVIKEALMDTDLYIFPTHEETEGIPILEACAMKCDALIRDIPVFEEWLVDGKNVHKAKDVDEFEQKIKQIISKELPKLSDEAYKVAQERDLKNIGIELKKIYENVLVKEYEKV